MNTTEQAAARRIERFVSADESSRHTPREVIASTLVSTGSSADTTLTRSDLLVAVAALDAIDRVRALHRVVAKGEGRGPHVGSCIICAWHSSGFPCETIRALDGAS